MSLLEHYEEVVGRHEIERLRHLAARLSGKRIIHVNSTRQGGGVAEILGWMVPLMIELGIDAHWEVIQGNADFYRVTKSFHNGLQGLPVSLRPADFKLHLDVNESNAQRSTLRGTSSSSMIPSRSSCRDSALAAGSAAGSGAATSTLRVPTAPCGSIWLRESRTTRPRSSRWRRLPGP